MSRKVFYTETNNRKKGKFQKLTLHLPLLLLAFFVCQVTYAQTSLSVSFSITEPSCFGLPNGKVTAAASGGVSPYTYVWSNGTMGATLNGISAGSYSVTITDAASNMLTQSVNVTQPPLITAAIESSASCSSPFTLTAIGGGGTQPYKYHWTTGQSTKEITVSAGTYCVTITDQKSCGAVSCITVKVVPLAVSAVATGVTCPDNNDGSVTATPEGGTAPFTYAWSNGQTTQTIQNLAPGTYSVTVTDSKGCSANASATVASKPPLILTINSTQPSCTDDTNGTVTAFPSGGTPPYTYLWNTGATTQGLFGVGAGTYTVTVTDNKGCEVSKTIILEPKSELEITVTGTNETCPDNDNGSATVMPIGGFSSVSFAWSNGAGTQSINNLAPGTYTVTVTDEAGCTATGSYTVQPAADLILEVTSTNVTTCDAANGTASANVTAGIAPYTYAWSNGATTAMISNLVGGMYTVTITDARGCTKTGSVTITEPPAISVNVVANGPICPGATTGQATANVVGGTAPFTYAWSNGGTTAMTSNLSAGTYTVTVTDANGCDANASATIMESPAISVNIDADEIVCGANATTNATAQVTGGVAPFSFLWSNGLMTQTIIGLTPGAYTVTVTDANGCSATDDITIATTILEADIRKQDVLCFAGESGYAVVTVSGGTEPYTYIWNNAETTDSIGGLNAGMYAVTITDANGCEIIETIEITQPADIVITLDASNLVCAAENDGSITANVTGGTAPYTYAWSNGETTQTITGLTAGTYTVTVTDANDCEKSASVTIQEAQGPQIEIQATEVVCGAENTGNAMVMVTGGQAPYTYSWSTGGNTNMIEDLASGTYSVTVEDANGCTATAEATVNIISDFAISVVPRNVLCNGDNSGSILVTAQGGTAPYTYNWSNGASTAEIIELIAGTYSVTITDANGCSLSESINITEPVELTTQVNKTDVTCFSANDGTAIVTASGGTTPYTYAWSNGQNTAEITGLTPGDYTVTVTDGNFCEVITTINITQPNALSATINITNLLCNGDDSGSATAVVAGGTAPYTYAWSNGSSTQTLDNLAAGSYTVTITDVNECSATAMATITEPDTLQLSLTVNNIVCTSEQIGTITAVVAGGTMPYTYAWSNGETTETIANLPAGSYTVTVTDANGCIVEATTGVAQIPNLELMASKTDVTCFGANDGTATVVASGDSPPYMYAWSNGEITDMITGLAPGTYTVTVTGTAGCVGEASVTIGSPTELTLNITKVDLSCNGASDGECTAVPAGGTAPYSYTWSNGSSTSNIDGLPAGTYSVTVTDANECTTEGSVTINEPDAITVMVNTMQGTCEDSSDGSVNATVNGGTAPYTYAWSNGGSGAMISDLAADTYSVTVTDANGCSATGSIVLNAFEKPVCTAVVIQEESFPNANDGIARAEVTGGTGPYEYRWNNGADTETITGLGVGTFSVTITDANGCSTSCEVELKPAARIGDFVWLDINRNGIQDPGEPGIGGVTVIVTGVVEDDAYADTTTTDANGIYGFDVPPPGNYKVTFILPPGTDLIPTLQNAGGDDARDSDVDPVMLMTQVFFIQRGDVDLTLDAGFYDRCVNITNPGTIGYDQYLCGPGGDPAPIIEISQPIGGEGEIQYLWMKSTVGGPFNNTNWQAIPNSNTQNYDPGPIYETTYFIRCTRRENCPYLETNIVAVVVGNETVAEINGSPLVCEDTPVSFFATNEGGTNSNYQWDLGPAAVPRYVVGRTANTTFASFGTFELKLTVSVGGCTSTAVRRITVTSLCGGLTIDADAVSQQEVLVKWSVANDGQDYEFAIDHSADGNTFQEIDRVNTPKRLENNMRHYEYMDTHPKTGRNYYRVRVIEGTNQETTSDVAQAILFANSELMHFYPNPVTDHLTIEIFDSLNDDIQMQVINANGTTMQTINVPRNAERQDLDFSNLPSGTYFIKVRYGRVDVKVLKVLKP